MTKRNSTERLILSISGRSMLELTLPDDHLLLIECTSTTQRTPRPIVPAPVDASDEVREDVVMIQDNLEIILGRKDPLVETSVTANIIRPPEISVVPGDTGYGSGAL